VGGIIIDNPLSTDNTIVGNTIDDNDGHPIYFDWGYGIIILGNNTVILNNTITNHANYGLVFSDGSSFGIPLIMPKDNVAKYNTFSDNGPAGKSQVADNGTSNIFEYNFYSEWTSPDSDGDGIVDIPYVIEGSANNIDSFPLTTEVYIVTYVTIVETIPAGTTDITVEGLVETTITLDVASSVEVTIETSSIAPSEDARQAFSVLENTGDIIGTGFFLEINISDPGALTDIWINISYADWDLVALGVDESLLVLMFYNETTAQWELAGNTGVDTVNKIIYAHLDHLSAFSAVAAIPQTPPSDTTDTTDTIDTTDTESTDSSTTSEEEPIPGFEGLILITVLINLAIIVNIRKKSRRN
jgi:hypothetical protein